MRRQKERTIQIQYHPDRSGERQAKLILLRVMEEARRDSMIRREQYDKQSA